METEPFIDRLSVDLKMKPALLPLEAQKMADAVVDRHVIPAVESVLEEMGREADERIPLIEIDVGRVRLPDLRDAIESALRNALAPYLSKTVEAPAAPFLDSLREYAGTGKIPWETGNAGFDLSRYLEEAFQGDLEKTVADRIGMFSEKELAGLLMLVYPDAGESGSPGLPDPVNRPDKKRVIRDLAFARLTREFPATASVIAARVASWRRFLGLASSASPASSGDGIPISDTLPEPERMMVSGSQEAGGEGIEPVSVPVARVFRYVEITLADIPEGVTVEALDAWDAPGPEAPEFILSAGPPLRYYRKVTVEGERPRREVPPVPAAPSYRYVEIGREEIPKAASLEVLEPWDDPGPEAPEYLLSVGPPLRYYRKVMVGAEVPLRERSAGADSSLVPVYVPGSESYQKAEYQYVEIGPEDILAGAPVQAATSMENPAEDSPEYLMMESPVVRYFRKVVVGKASEVSRPAPEEERAGGGDRPGPAPLFFRYVEIGLADVPQDVPVEIGDYRETPGPDDPEYLMTPGPSARYFRKMTVAREADVESGQGPVSVTAAPGKPVEKMEEGSPWPAPFEPGGDPWRIQDFETGWTEERIPVSDAGLVLVHPFFRLLLEHTGLVKDGDFVSPPARVRAVHLLRDLVGSPEPHASHTLILEKILCGLPPAYVVPQEWEPSPEEKEETEALLKAVCGYWKPLKGSSIDALRGGFVDRSGTVEPFGDSWIVKVEGRTIDILLDDLPWELSLIHLPWLKDPVAVEWQQEEA